MRSTTRRAVRAGARAAARFAAALVFAPSLHAAPYRPSNDELVLEQLPASVVALRDLRTRQRSDTRDLTQALADAQRYIELGRTFGDPRAYGYAEAALGPWWRDANADPALHITRARILQFRHDFSGALAELESALAAEPFNADGWLLFAGIEQVRGNARAARAACLKLLPIADPLTGATCVAASAALEGRVAQGARLLTQALAQPTATSAAERAWSWTTLAELRARSGNAPAAEAAFGAALALAPDDVYTRAAYADFLLDQGRAGEVRQLLDRNPRSDSHAAATRAADPTAIDEGQPDALLLRLAIAARRKGDGDAATLAAVMAERFAEARLRGDTTHLREQARFALECAGDARGALDLAKRNFNVQREAADARILLDAASAAGDSAAAQAARRWLAGDVGAPRAELAKASPATAER